MKPMKAKATLLPRIATLRQQAWGTLTMSLLVLPLGANAGGNYAQISVGLVPLT